MHAPFLHLKKFLGHLATEVILKNDNRLIDEEGGDQLNRTDLLYSFASIDRFV